MKFVWINNSKSHRDRSAKNSTVTEIFVSYIHKTRKKPQFLYDRVLRHERVKPGLALHVASFNLKKHPNTLDNTLNLLVRSCILWLCFCLSKVPKSDITVLTWSKNLQKSWYCKQVQSSWYDIYLSSDGWHHSETGQVLFKRRQMQTIFRSRCRFR